jgi:hypothetical protein
MSRMVVVVTVAFALFAYAKPGSAQYIFMDVDGDGMSSEADKLTQGESTSIDIWIQTDVNRDGSPAEARVVGNRPLTINQYEFILRAAGGSIGWEKYTNLQPTMSIPFGQRMNATDFYTGFAGLEALAPGKYKLGTLKVSIASGRPRLVFASSSPLWRGAGTSFGSQRQGKDGDNSLKFTDDPSKLGWPSTDVRGDWADATGLEGPNSGLQLAPAQLAALPASFSVRLSPNPANPEATIQIRTTKAGFIRVRIFDLSGRLVRTALAEASAPAGIHTVRVPGTRNGRAMPSGVYLYRVETAERSVEGKLLIVK